MHHERLASSAFGPVSANPGSPNGFFGRGELRFTSLGRDRTAHRPWGESAASPRWSAGTRALFPLLA